jgi:hypothetical protein
VPGEARRRPVAVAPDGAPVEDGDVAHHAYMASRAIRGKAPDVVRCADRP